LRSGLGRFISLFNCVYKAPAVESGSIQDE
jgi:hypothetical protein